MPFREKTAWILSIALVIGAGAYFGVVVNLSNELDRLVPPMMPLVAAFTAIVIVIAVVGHVVIAILTPKEADAPLDEREQKIFQRAGHVSGLAFGAGVITSLGYYLVSPDGNLLFYNVFASLVISQIFEYAIQIYLYRTGA